MTDTQQFMLKTMLELSDSPPESSDLRVWSKLLFGAILCVCALFGGLIAFLMKKRSASYLKLGISFSGGILLSGGLLHLVPDSREQLESINVYFPFTELFCIAGLLLVILIESLAVSVITFNKNSHQCLQTQPANPFSGSYTALHKNYGCLNPSLNPREKPGGDYSNPKLSNSLDTLKSLPSRQSVFSRSEGFSSVFKSSPIFEGSLGYNSVNVSSCARQPFDTHAELNCTSQLGVQGEGEGQPSGHVEGYLSRMQQQLQGGTQREEDGGRTQVSLPRDEGVVRTQLSLSREEAMAALYFRGMPKHGSARKLPASMRKGQEASVEDVLSSSEAQLVTGFSNDTLSSQPVGSQKSTHTLNELFFAPKSARRQAPYADAHTLEKLQLSTSSFNSELGFNEKQQGGVVRPIQNGFEARSNSLAYGKVHDAAIMRGMACSVENYSLTGGAADALSMEGFAYTPDDGFTGTNAYTTTTRGGLHPLPDNRHAHATASSMQELSNDSFMCEYLPSYLAKPVPSSAGSAPVAHSKAGGFQGSSDALFTVSAPEGGGGDGDIISPLVCSTVGGGDCSSMLQPHEFPLEDGASGEESSFNTHELQAASTFALNKLKRSCTYIKLDDEPYDLEAQHGHSWKISNIKGMCLFLALSFHSIMEGVSLSASTNPWLIFLAIVAHKSIASFGLISSLAGVSGHCVKSLVIEIVCFSLMTPLGILLGLIILYTGLGLSTIATGVLTALGSGTFLYVSLVEILASQVMLEMHKHSGLHHVMVFSTFILGTAAMGVLALFV